VSPGEILREARQRHEVSQRELAIRAGTTQSAISRIEKDRVSPSVETLRSLLFVLGEDLVLGSESRDFGIDKTLNELNFTFTPAQRVRRTMEFADFVRRNRGVANRPRA
jgi:transcriptional regulator with XRE-family HTH domain